MDNPEPYYKAVAKNNSLRYRGYVADDETGFYYLQSRYYDPVIRRFINADAFVSTGQSFLGYNMFAYCGNNPVNCVDPSGEFFEELWDAFTQTLQEFRGYFLTAAGITQLDSLAPGPADVVAASMAVVGVFVCTSIAVGEVVFAKPSTEFDSLKSKFNFALETQKPNVPIVFPTNPNEFHPVGLIPVLRPGTKNGRFISWMDPITKTEVFRWDENLNYSNGPHYHVYGQGHFYAGDLVPEPFASIYFPFQ